MSDMQKDTRNMVDVLKESLAGADRVVIETKNAVGAMDAHYLHAPALLADLAQAPAAPQVSVKDDPRVMSVVSALKMAILWLDYDGKYDTVGMKSALSNLEDPAP